MPARSADGGSGRVANWFLRHLPTRLVAALWFVAMGLFAAMVADVWVRVALEPDGAGAVVALIVTAAAGIPIAKESRHLARMLAMLRTGT
jgi:hypothetical protein